MVTSFTIARSTIHFFFLLVAMFLRFFHQIFRYSLQRITMLSWATAMPATARVHLHRAEIACSTVFAHVRVCPLCALESDKRRIRAHRILDHLGRSGIRAHLLSVIPDRSCYITSPSRNPCLDQKRVRNIFPEALYNFLVAVFLCITLRRCFDDLHKY